MSLDAALSHPFLRTNYYDIVSDFERERFDFSVRKSERRSHAHATAGLRRTPVAVADRSTPARHNKSNTEVSSESSSSNTVGPLCHPASSTLASSSDSIKKSSTETVTCPLGKRAVSFAPNLPTSQSKTLSGGARQQGIQMQKQPQQQQQKCTKQQTRFWLHTLEPLAEQSEQVEQAEPLNEKLDAVKTQAVAGTKVINEGDDADGENDGESDLESELPSHLADGESDIDSELLSSSPLIDWQSLRDDLPIDEQLLIDDNPIDMLPTISMAEYGDASSMQFTLSGTKSSSSSKHRSGRVYKDEMTDL